MGLARKLIYKGYVILLMVFTIWYGTFMFNLIFGFEGKQQAGSSFESLTGSDEPLGTDVEKMFDKLMAEQSTRSETDIGHRIIDQPFIEGRFHHIGFEMQMDKTSMCVKCHGNITHNESKDLRSFLNMHSFFLACETCHARPEEGAEPWQFRWYDKETSKVVQNPAALKELVDSIETEQQKVSYPTYGNYGAKIAPVEIIDGEFTALHGEKEMTFVEFYVGEQDHLLPEKKSQMETIIHRKVASEPIACDGCHTEQEAYIPFRQLGYPPTWRGHQTAIAVVGMLRKYSDFFFPSLLQPGGRDSEE